jgi:hypothetical protein
MLRIFDSNHDQISRNTIISKNRFNIYAHQKFTIQILKFSKDAETNPPRLYDLEHNSVDYLENIYFCTLYIPKNETKVVIRVFEDFTHSVFVDYMVEYNDGNILSDDQQHYNDIMTNKGMPPYEDIAKSVIPESDYDSRELIKKLLLDLNKIFKNKGTKESVENFFKFLGYEDYTDNRLIISDILDDNQEKTGYYEALYHYYKQIYRPEFDENNLPNVEINILNIDGFKEALLHAIKIANKYFTTEEQLIDVVNIQFSANSPKFDSIVSRNRLHFQYDALYFRHDVKINVHTYDEYERFKQWHVKDTATINLNLPKHEIKYFMTAEEIAEIQSIEFFKITDEIFEDTEILPSQMADIRRGFGAILHISVTIPSTTITTRRWVETEFYNIEDPSIKITTPRVELDTDDEITEQIAVFKNGVYRFLVNIYDTYGAKETYFYDFVLAQENVRIDTDVFTSKNLTSLNNPNEIYQDTTVPNLSLTEVRLDIPVGNNVFVPINSYQLSQADVPTNLATYYDVDSPMHIDRWLSKKYVRQFEKFNMNYRLKDITESIPIALIDSFLDINVLPKSESDEDIYVEIYDPFSKTRLVPLSELNESMSPLDNLFVFHSEIFERRYRVLDDYVDVSLGDHWVIIGMLSGFNLDNFNERIFIKRGAEYIRITEVEGFYKSKQPLYYDIPMAITQDEVTEYYASDTGLYAYVKQQDDTVETIPCIKSLFPHLTKMRDYHESYGLKLNDVVYAAVSPKYIDYPFECEWDVQDTFTHESLKFSKSKTLLYRYKLKNIIDILLKFYLQGFDQTYEHVKLLQSVQSYQES